MSKLIDAQNLKKKDFETDQDVRWCPGCGDYSILANVQKVMPELGIVPDDIVWISGIGCSSRFPYYMNTYGFHTIHGRAPAFVTGLKLANPKLSVWMATGDGDGLSIGGNHLMHALRRNIDAKMLMFNNRIYGLTKGQYSPTSEVGKVTRSTPFGSVDQPVDPAEFALGVGASFVARAIDTDAKNLGAVLRQAASHSGAAFTEIYQNCNVFNDGAFEDFRSREHKFDRQIHVEHGQPLLFGKEKNRGLRLNPVKLALEVVEVGEGGVSIDEVLVHDQTNITLAGMLARMPFGEFPIALGLIYCVPRPTFDGGMEAQMLEAQEKSSDLDALLRSGNTWEVTS
ncbi:MAG: 2-oxoacid:ferredoxin oxidoreductase subunit beta [Polyangiaceae bacterium]|nr:2-oxoacid:ferredoxin oxidoreductase subunit beta [Polyangiaceae bacterium]